MNSTSLILGAAIVTSLVGCADAFEIPNREAVPPSMMMGEDPMGPSAMDSDLWIDTSSANPYLTLEQSTVSIPGAVFARNGLDRIEQGSTDSATPLTVNGMDFTATANVEPGMSVVPLRAYDTQEQMVKGHRAILRADYLPEGVRNPNAVLVSVTNAMLAAIGGNASGAVSDLDLKPQFAPGTPVAAAFSCVTFQGGNHGVPTVALSSVDGQLQLKVTIPSLSVNLAGTCNVPLLGSVNLDGTITGNIVVTANLASTPTADGECVSGFTHSNVEVDVENFAYMRSQGRFVPNLLLRWASGLFGGAVGKMFEGQVNTLLADKLANFPIELPAGAPIDFFGASLNLDMCITKLGPENGVLVAQLGAGVIGSAPGDEQGAPGAPMLTSELPTPASGKLYLDANLVGQLLYGAWARGGLEQVVENNLIAFPLRDVPGLSELVPAPTNYTVTISAPLAPLVTIADPAENADLMINIGELTLRFEADGRHILTVGSKAEIALGLEPNEAGGMVPTVAGVTSSVWILETPLGPISEFKQKNIEGSIGEGVLSVSTLAGLFGELAISLPEVGGPMKAAAVEPLAGGMLEITLAP